MEVMGDMGAFADRVLAEIGRPRSKDTSRRPSEWPSGFDKPSASKACAPRGTPTSVQADVASVRRSGLLADLTDGAARTPASPSRSSRSLNGFRARGGPKARGGRRPEK